MKKIRVNLILLIFLIVITNISAQYQKAGGVELEVYFRVFGEGEPLLIIGGGPGDNSDRYLSLCELLSSDIRSIMPDQRGTGKSIPVIIDSTTISIELTIADFEAIRKKLGLKKWHVLGFSYGGYLASLYAHFYPESISSLVLLGSAGLNTGFFGHFRDNIFSRMQTQDKDKYEFWVDSARYVNNPNHALAEIVRAMMPGYFYDRKKSLLVSEAITDTSFDISGMGKWIWSDIRKRNLDLSEMKQVFRDSVLILHGRQDPLGESVPQELSRYYNKSKLVFVEKAGHYSWIEQPEKIQSAINNFLIK
jgi:proline iminopeptidase